MTNCKQGDMARIVAADLPSMLSTIVHVVRPANNRTLAHWGALWWCKPAWPVKTMLVGGMGRTGWSYGDALIIPDCDLRPIRPDAEPVDTDVVAEVGA